MSGPTRTHTRRIAFDAYKPSGKWYASGFAWIRATDHYWQNDRLLADIDATNDQLLSGSIESAQYNIAVREMPDDTDVFVSRLILAAR